MKVNIKGLVDLPALFVNVKEAALLLRALNNKIRQSILKLFEVVQRLTVTEIIKKLKLEQSIASQHLAILRRARILSSKREGKFIYYQLNTVRINEIHLLAVSMIIIKPAQSPD